MRRTIIGSMATIMTIAVQACAPSSNRLSPDEQILRRVLQGLSMGGYPLCVDSGTQSASFRLWHDSMVIARAAGHDLGWQRPVALRPPADMPEPVWDTAKQRALVAPLTRQTSLPHQEVADLEAAANRLAVQQDAPEQIILRSRWMPAHVTTRWWPLNRISRGCEPYRLSAPQRVGNLAFVQVQVNHWGTVYALRRATSGWRVIGQAAPWLY